jgi:hypothetical protein
MDGFRGPDGGAGGATHHPGAANLNRFPGCQLLVNPRDKENNKGSKPQKSMSESRIEHLVTPNVRLRKAPIICESMEYHIASRDILRIDRLKVVTVKRFNRSPAHVLSSTPIYPAHAQ